MQQEKEKLVRPWRKNPESWTDTMFDKRALENPQSMTNRNLSAALREHNEWRRGVGKYEWDCTEESLEKLEQAEPDAPFSPSVLGKLIEEAARRLEA